MVKIYDETATPVDAVPDFPASPPTFMDGLILVACGVFGPCAAAFVAGCLCGLFVMGFRWIAG